MAGTFEQLVLRIVAHGAASMGAGRIEGNELIIDQVDQQDRVLTLGIRKGFGAIQWNI